jgi:hypothetical protein
MLTGLIVPQYVNEEMATPLRQPTRAIASSSRVTQAAAKTIDDLNSEQTVAPHLLDLTNLDNLESESFVIQGLTVATLTGQTDNIPVATLYNEETNSIKKRLACCLEILNNVKTLKTPLRYCAAGFIPIIIAGVITFGMQHPSRSLEITAAALSIFGGLLMFTGVTRAVQLVAEPETRAIPITV